MFIVKITMKIMTALGKASSFNNLISPIFGRAASNTAPSIVEQARIEVTGPICPIPFVVWRSARRTLPPGICITARRHGMGTERIRACSGVRLVVAVVATTNKAAIKIGITTGKNDLRASFIDFKSGFLSKITIEIIYI